MIEFKHKPIEYYIELMKRKKYFAFPGYSDAEWFSILGERIGHTTGLGQVLDATHGGKLLDVFERRADDPRWMFAVPECLWDFPQLKTVEGNRIENLMRGRQISCPFYERDMVTDNLARRAGLYPLVKQARKMQTVMIGPVEFYPQMFQSLKLKRFVLIPSPNLHMKNNGIEKCVETVLGGISQRRSSTEDALYLISAGVSAAVIIDRLYQVLPNNFYFDCGSIWDAFVGIGGQREWRADLYASPERLEQWKRKNLNAE